MMVFLLGHFSNEIIPNLFKFNESRGVIQGAHLCGYVEY